MEKVSFHFICSNCSYEWISDQVSRCHDCNSADIQVDGTLK